MELMFQIVVCKRSQYEGAKLIPAGEGARGPDCYSQIQVRNPCSFFVLLLVQDIDIKMLNIVRINQVGVGQYGCSDNVG